MTLSNLRGLHDPVRSESDARAMRLATAAREMAQRQTALKQDWSRMLEDQAAAIDQLVSVRSEREAQLEAENRRLRALCGDTADWLNSLHRANLEEIAADGGVTVGMIFQRDAAWEATQLNRAALSTTASRGGDDEQP